MLLVLFVYSYFFSTVCGDNAILFLDSTLLILVYLLCASNLKNWTLVIGSVPLARKKYFTYNKIKHTSDLAVQMTASANEAKSDVDAFVLTYLKKKGYRQAELAFQSEAKVRTAF